MPNIDYLEQVQPAVPPAAPASYFVDIAEVKQARLNEVLRLQAAPLPGAVKRVLHGRPTTLNVETMDYGTLRMRLDVAMNDLQLAATNGGRVNNTGSNRHDWTATEVADDAVVLSRELADRLETSFPREVSA